jgi:hypothetical protein
LQLGERRRQANNNLLSFPYGGRFKKRKRTDENADKSRLCEPGHDPGKSDMRGNLAPGRQWATNKARGS